MSLLKKIEREFENDKKKSSQENEYRKDDLHNIFAHVLDDQDFDRPIPEKFKNEIKQMVLMLSDFYDSKISPSDSTMLDAFEYIPLFCLNGAILASLINIPYEDYLRIVDIMIVLTGVGTEDV